MYALVFVLVSVLVCIRMRMHVRERVRVRMRVRIRMSAAIRCSQPDAQPDSSLPPFARHVGSQAGYLAYGSQPVPETSEFANDCGSQPVPETRCCLDLWLFSYVREEVRREVRRRRLHPVVSVRPWAVRLRR